MSIRTNRTRITEHVLIIGRSTDGSMRKVYQLRQILHKKSSLLRTETFKFTAQWIWKLEQFGKDGFIMWKNYFSVRHALLRVCQHFAVCGERCTIPCGTKFKGLRLQNPNVLATNSFKTYTLYLTLRLLMSYIYGAPILDVSRSHTTTHHSR